MTRIAANIQQPKLYTSTQKFKPQIAPSTLVAGIPGQSVLIKAIKTGFTKAGEFTMGKLLQEAAKRGIPKITKDYIATQAVQSVERLTAAQMQDPRLVTSLILGTRVGGHSIGKLAVGAGVSTASIAASLASAKQVGSFNIPDKRNGFLEVALGVFWLNTDSGNTVDEAKIIKFNQLYKQYLPKFERAELQWRRANSERTPEEVIKKFSPWLQDQIHRHGMTIEKANEITTRSDKAKYVDETTGRRIGCHTTGFVTQYQLAQYNKKTFFVKNDTEIKTSGFISSVGEALKTRTILKIRDNYTQEVRVLEDTGLVSGQSIINSSLNHYLNTQPLSSTQREVKKRTFRVSVYGTCIFPDGSEMKATNEVRIHYLEPDED